ncbi:HK97 gp10 family phage protein [Nitrobacter sp. TKz-YC01]|uniref:HK97 gp10 family phage protein n=1 Tax=Nitrobacter sp. TKz-YC01 TaxID=3398703 RepID=UPI003A100D8A
MAIKAKFLGREAVMKKLNAMLPEAERELAEAQMDVAREAASRIAARAPVGATGDYKSSIEADRIGNRPHQELTGIRETKDKNATAVFAKFTWRWLEFGTVNMKKGARPHIFPTWRAYRKTARRKMAAAVNKAVRKAKS